MINLEKIAKELSKKTKNEDINNVNSIGFIRVMMYSCLFFSATKQCTKMLCENCKADKLIKAGVEIHSELTEEYCYLKSIRKK